MSLPRTRRDVLRDVGRGMFVASLGPAVAFDLGLTPAPAAEGADRLTFGDLDPLVNFIHETPPARILTKTVEKLNAGLDLRTLTAAAALANARAFGGEDYVGFHTLMALAPAYHMSREEKDPARKPLAVLKVLYRNATRLSEMGQTKAEVLKPILPSLSDNGLAKPDLRAAVRAKNADAAERAFARQCRSATPDAALDAVMEIVDDATEVHRIVLVSRAWDLLDFVGKERAETMLRQSIRYCVKTESTNPNPTVRDLRAMLPKLLDQYKLVEKPPGTKAADDAWVSKLAETIFRATPAGAAEAVAGALAEGFHPDEVGRAVAVAACELTLRDNGRYGNQVSPGKPAGSCHGDSIGVHACDSAHAWRTVAKAGGRRTAASSLVLAGYQVALDRGNRGGDFFNWQPYPRPEHVEKAATLAPDKLLAELGGAVRENDQGRAAAVAARLGDGHAAEAFALLRDFAVSEDGALHAEKYYRTTTAEAADARPGHKTRQLVALARVTASACGQPAPGMTEAKQLLKV